MNGRNLQMCWTQWIKKGNMKNVEVTELVKNSWSEQRITYWTVPVLVAKAWQFYGNGIKVAKWCNNSRKTVGRIGNGKYTPIRDLRKPEEMTGRNFQPCHGHEFRNRTNQNRLNRRIGGFLYF